MWTKQGSWAEVCSVSGIKLELKEGASYNKFPYLNLMGEVGRMPEWVSYVSQLREDNKKRPRFLSTLDRINRKKIMDP